MDKLAIPTSAPQKEERIGLAIAIILHLGVVAALLIQPTRGEVLDRPERVTVSLASEVSLESTAPSPEELSRAAVAPTIAQEPDQVGEQIPEARPETAPPTRTERAIKPPRPRDERPRRRPEQRAAQQDGGGSLIGEDFLDGKGTDTKTESTRAPAPTFGRRERASLAAAVNRQLRPHWSAPQGVDTELLVSVVAFELNPDGSLKGRPRLVSQSGINDSNRPQAALHGERAIRAVQLAAPFKLPEQFYERWKSLESQFDRRL